MAGGPTTPALVSAVQAAGGFAFLAAGYKTAGAMRDEIEAVRGGGAFGVNLFVPGRELVDGPAFAAYAAALADEAAALGVRLPAEPVSDDDGWGDKLDVLATVPVPVVSLTFGLPSDGDITRLQRAGSVVLATVTTAGEAREAEAAGVDGLVVQGPRAGGHSGTFDPARGIGSDPTIDVVRAVRAASALPLVAAGGVDGPGSVATLLGEGVESVAVGTQLLLAEEAGTSPTHRRALTDPAFTETVVTHAFTGRPARGLRNDFIDRHDAQAPLGYPALHHLTRELRQAAARAGDAQRLHLWAGTGYASVRPGPAAAILRGLLAAT